MAYETTDVAVSKSQDSIRKMIYAHKGTGVVFISHPPTEGFEAMVTINNQPYHIRVIATGKDVSKDNSGTIRVGSRLANAKAQEERRVWRVLCHHLKAQFEAADSGVLSFEDIIMPYIVLRDNRTISQAIKQDVAGLIEHGPKLLLAGK